MTPTMATDVKTDVAIGVYQDEKAEANANVATRVTIDVGAYATACAVT